MSPVVYPTKEQILAEPRPTFLRGTFSAISEWKKLAYMGWDINASEPRRMRLYLLSLHLPLPPGKYHAPDVQIGEVDMYAPVGNTIYLKEPLSILSFLHEYAHYLFGPDELTACRWSVWLYQLRFRNDYNKLVWKGHLLVKPSPSEMPLSKCASRYLDALQSPSRRRSGK